MMRKCVRTLRPLLSHPAKLHGKYICTNSFDRTIAADLDIVGDHEYTVKRSGKLQETTERLDHLEPWTRDLYPRMIHRGRSLTCQEFLEAFAPFETASQLDGQAEVHLQGRVSSIRLAGSRLLFFDLLNDGHRVQSLCNFRHLIGAGVSVNEFRKFHRAVRRGDILGVTGFPHRSDTGELSLRLSELPMLLSPCMLRLPTELQDKETKIRNRHVDFLVNRRTAETIRLRAEIIQYLRQYLLNRRFLEMQTPVLADKAGGAIARSFQTSATEFPDRNISLRIAPELWLKRLVIGGFDRVFEIGPSFRNEGLNLTHNPEFTTCEFYRSYFDIEDLMGMTEDMLSGLAKHVENLRANSLKTLEGFDLDFSTPFKRIDFILGIEAALGHNLPDLQSLDAKDKVADIFQRHSIPMPTSPTLPNMLDRLCATYLEPRCKNPTFIINQPECLSPLSKSFDHPSARQRVSARAELFANSQEIINTYEEENSPIEQRKKFVNQLQFRSGGDILDVDESYIEALKWGLPPTGGWGCGIERLCMLLSGATRIGDVLSFGTLRNVVASNRGRTP